MSKAPTPAAAVAAKRELRAAKIVERDRLNRAGPNVDEAGAALDAWVSRVATQADERLTRVAEAAARGRDVGEAMKLPVRYDEVDVASLLVMLLGTDGLRALLGTKLAEYAQPGPGAAERALLVSKLNAEIKALEAEEERLIRAAEAVGHRIERRGDADPSIVLAEVLP